MNMRREGIKNIKNFKFKISLNEEQKLAKAEILQNDISVVLGKSGSGKTLLACQIALDMLNKKQIEKIYITRPTVSKEEIGFLPGDIKEKLDPWLAPIYGNFNLLLVKHRVQELFDSDVVEIVPVSFMRGRTFPKAAIIVDECQNLEDDQTLMILQRIGRGSKMMFCGDAAQTDLKRKSRSGLGYLASLADKIKGLGIVELLSNHRHPILDEIIPMYESKNK